MWEQKGIRGIKRNARFLRDVVKPAESVLLTTEVGVITGPGPKILCDSTVLQSVIERMVRGLYYHHCRVSLPRDIIVLKHYFPKLDEGVRRVIGQWELKVIGDGQFVYRHFIPSERPLFSRWIFEFHGAFWAGGGTESVSTCHDSDVGNVGLQRPRADSDRANVVVAYRRWRGGRCSLWRALARTGRIELTVDDTAGNVWAAFDAFVDEFREENDRALKVDTMAPHWVRVPVDDNECHGRCSQEGVGTR